MEGLPGPSKKANRQLSARLLTRVYSNMPNDRNAPDTSEEIPRITPIAITGPTGSSNESNQLARLKISKTIKMLNE
ncbi:hypothetical protein QCA50_012983 [Cerrena zonata]|uniref:Uncharacterized protein n=1 Tax=Cerrena zonata TaxID=2478898 RepID=A0AAW0FV52_9APHY